MSYSEFHSGTGEDAWIVEHIKNLPDKGVFVDVGAASAIFRNNTYYFEKNGWTGICIDADPHWFKECDGKCGEPSTCQSLTKYRKQCLNVAVGDSNKMVTFNQCHRGVLSHRDDIEHLHEITKWTNDVVNKIEIQQRTLNSIVEEYSINKIDLMSIDVEMMDYEVWNSFDYKKCPVDILIIEYYHMGKDKFKELMENFHSDYSLVYDGGANFIYLHKRVKYDYDTKLWWE